MLCSSGHRRSIYIIKLGNNNFTFNGCYYNKVKCIGTGTNFAPTYSTLVFIFQNAALPRNWIMSWIGVLTFHEKDTGNDTWMNVLLFAWNQTIVWNVNTVNRRINGLQTALFLQQYPASTIKSETTFDMIPYLRRTSKDVKGWKDAVNKVMACMPIYWKEIDSIKQILKTFTYSRKSQADLAELHTGLVDLVELTRDSEKP